MPRLRSSLVAVYVVRRDTFGRLEFLLPQRPPDHRFAGSWQPVGGHIEEGETAWQAALREVQEETALPIEGWFRIDRPETFYNPENDTIYFIPAFVALAAPGVEPTISDEHSDWRWSAPAAAAASADWQNMRDSILFVAEALRDPNQPAPGVWEFSPADLQARQRT